MFSSILLINVCFFQLKGTCEELILTLQNLTRKFKSRNELTITLYSWKNNSVSANIDMDNITLVKNCKSYTYETKPKNKSLCGLYTQNFLAGQQPHLLRT